MKCHKVTGVSQFFIIKTLKYEEKKLGFSSGRISIEWHWEQFGITAGIYELDESSHSEVIRRSRQVEFRSLRLV